MSYLWYIFEKLAEIERKNLQSFSGGQAYSVFERENMDYTLPDLEIFPYGLSDFMRDYGESAHPDLCGFVDCAGEFMGEGWYYWYCFPGCLPDSDAFGPFDTAGDALYAARNDLLWLD